MTDKQVRVGDLLKIQGFDPMNVDVTYIKQTIAMIPSDGSMDMNEAERLATVFLRCADYCSELMAQAIRFLGHTDALKKSERASSIERKVAAKTPATTAKETYSNDPLYVEAAEKNTDAQAFLTWIQQKYENLIKAHVLCKDLMKSHAQNRIQSDWEGVEEEPSKPATTTPKEETDELNGDDFEIDVG